MQTRCLQPPRALPGLSSLSENVDTHYPTCSSSDSYISTYDRPHQPDYNTKHQQKDASAFNPAKFVWEREPFTFPDHGSSSLNTEEAASTSTKRKRRDLAAIKPSPNSRVPVYISPNLEVEKHAPVPPRVLGQAKLAFSRPDATLDAPSLGALEFCPNFESGNLLYVTLESNTNTYYLSIRPDFHTLGHCQWFYFTVGNMKPDNDHILSK
ncbi:hypothetical protein SeMB42_g07830 [Synchytrium endobioticum]|uniref:Cytosolic carboxypeptidase N-terminal domain-containing protein n=1 Tax=Synchytrium endobioticum TaxID=286115 RepID=A0A507BTR4_9FUNG|nr:hypothetical protein SeMB42_g07830 [Synchytrium endobioticum]